MKRIGLCMLAVAVAVPVGLASTGAAAAAPVRGSSRPACAAVAPLHARCAALVALNQRGSTLVSAGPGGLNPADLQDAYKLPSATNGAGQTVAIVDAFDDPNAEADLQVYRNQFGLPTCTTANGCFKKIDQNGGTSYPPGDQGWAAEISLDVDMVSAICPNCHILLVEANSNSFSNLYTAVNRAVTQGAKEVSNSWLGGEYSGEQNDSNTYFNHPGVAITAASGDGGFGTGMPAASQYVTAVGGTHLVKAAGSTRGWKETAWGGAGSGCSQFIAKPAWQHDKGCPRRMVSDVSAVADPATGVSVYDTYGLGGWTVFGGTSVATPIIASVYALAGDAFTFGEVYNNHTKANIYDIKKGSNGSCSPAYFCNAKKGYDGPTGWGTPRGIGDF